MAVAAALAVAVVGAAMALRDRGPDSTDVVTDNVGEVPRFLLDEPPAGLLPTGAVDLPLADAGGVAQTYWVYGDPDAADPFAEADLGVVVSSGPDVVLVPPDDSREVVVDGRSAWVSTSGDPGEMWSVTFEVDGDSIAYVASRSLSDQALVEAVAAVDLSGDAPRQIGGLDLVAVSNAGPTGTIPLPLPTSRGHIAGYQNEDGDAQRYVAVASVEGGEDAYLVARWALGPTARAVAIRGTEGWAGSPFGNTSTILVWRESPTNLVAVLTDGLDEPAAIAAAESLQVAGDDVWEALVSRTGQVRVPSDALAGVTSAEEDGSSYVAYVDGDGSLCLEVETVDGSSGTCSGGDAGPLVVHVGALGDGRFVVYGLTTFSTDSEVRITADGAPAGSEAYYEDGTVFAFVVGAGEIPDEIVVQAPDGKELGRATVPAPGSATFEGTATTMSG
jgi:hypothetical protein